MVTVVVAEVVGVVVALVDAVVVAVEVADVVCDEVAVEVTELVTEVVGVVESQRMNPDGHSASPASSNGRHWFVATCRHSPAVPKPQLSQRSKSRGSRQRRKPSEQFLASSSSNAWQSRIPSLMHGPNP